MDNYYVKIENIGSSNNGVRSAYAASEIVGLFYNSSFDFDFCYVFFCGLRSAVSSHIHLEKWEDGASLNEFCFCIFLASLWHTNA